MHQVAVLLLLLFGLFGSFFCNGGNLIGTSTASRIRTASQQQNASSHFVLVHGAGHGAWCWYKVIDQLQKRGHRVSDVDLTSAGINGVDPRSVTSLEQYSGPLLQLLRSVPRGHKIILVGHSLGGDSLTYVMEKYPHQIAAAMFVAANMFPRGSNGTFVYNQLFYRYIKSSSKVDAYKCSIGVNLQVITNNKAVQNSKVYFYSNGSKTPVAAAFKLDLVQDVLYHLSPSKDVVLAKLLLKPRPLFKHHSAELSREKYGSIPRI
ncbi:putative methylesterase 13, chloroplastic isoform X3 [Selaginella moellendorffii]|uniref:putative methylesterase 13, chloroplastic isoform X3 n=1 Tax=Selaginella moellendorffii TaxID=88036 RepID=UPI000D1C3D85|nr:putative methylesterase 13, chloroplastic isoform X3 [Selaginella moellendorffii]|eukprot:XP_024518172.1 putative methylesterase 13, chloroplastic isoform X3 [Selaginella moellendorffii]